MKNFVAPGEMLTITAPADVVSGDVVALGALVGVAASDAVSGEDVVIQRHGIFELPKSGSQAWTQGAKIYWAAGDARATTVASGNTLIGAAAAAAESSAPTGRVLLDGTIR